MQQGLPEAKIICDSVNPEGIRLTTMEVKLHRFVLAELNTHRVFSRNSASSRAIPVKKMVERVKNDPAMPLFWGRNKAGMGAAEELEETPKKVAIGQWLLARDQAVQTVQMLTDLGLHKQLTNRLLEPWLWHTAIISSTEWSNFFGQRCAINPETKQPYAQPEMFALAMAMQKAYYESTPDVLDYGDWHLPYIQKEDWEWLDNYWGNTCSGLMQTYTEPLRKISVGRCARVSYLTHDGIRDPAEDIILADKLLAATPVHPSPFEHVATPVPEVSYNNTGNFRGWEQMRSQVKNQNILDFVPNYEEVAVT